MAEEKKVTKTEKKETPKKEVAKLQPEEKKTSEIGTIGEKKVFQKSSFIKFKVKKSPISLQELPTEIRQYLINKGLGTNVYERPKERLEKHHIDMEIIEKLKKFISWNYQ